MKFTTLLPLTDNDGKDMTDTVRAITQSLAVQFGGCSIEGIVEGCWMDNGVMYNDSSMRVSVVCDDSRRDEARQRVTEIGHELRQLAMYFEVSLTAEVEFIRMV